MNNDHSIADVLRNAINDAQDLVRGEIALAKAEMREEVRRVGAGVVLMAFAAVAGIVATIFLLAALAWGLTGVFAWPVWLGFGLVGVLVALLAGLLAYVGRSRFNGDRYMPLTVDTLKENMQWMRAQKS
jgi:hypothetical protein